MLKKAKITYYEALRCLNWTYIDGIIILILKLKNEKYNFV